MLLNSDEIEQIIPHRYPFLLVDRIDEIIDNDGETRVIGSKCVSVNEPFFQGHFPGKKVMPGVLVLESLAQCGAVALLKMKEFKNKLVYFTGANNVKWRKMVIAGDVLKLEVKLGKLRHGFGSGLAIATVDGELACQAEISFAVR